MKHILLLGAGFSRNWGGWLADEAFEYLLGAPEIAANRSLAPLLWKHHRRGGFEDALAELQQAYMLNPQTNLNDLIDLQAAVKRMFDDMNYVQPADQRKLNANGVLRPAFGPAFVSMFGEVGATKLGQEPKGERILHPGFHAILLPACALLRGCNLAFVALEGFTQRGPLGLC